MSPSNFWITLLPWFTPSAHFWDCFTQTHLKGPGWRSGSFLRKLCVCQSELWGPSFSSGVSKNQTHYWMRCSTPWLCPLFSLNHLSPSAPVNCGGFYVSLQMTLLLLPDLTWKHKFSIFSLPLEASSFCYLTLQLYPLTPPSILTCCLLKSWKLILLLQTPPRLKVCACALCIITLVDNRDKKFNKIQC